MLTAIGLAMAGRAGTRLASQLDLPASRTGLLRLVMALPDPETGTLTIVRDRRLRVPAGPGLRHHPHQRGDRQAR